MFAKMHESQKRFFNNHNSVAKIKIFPIFALLNKKEKILLKRLTAGLFLSLFLFIHVVKLIHKHDPSQALSKETFKKVNASSLTNCSVCDYHVAKNSYHFTEFPLLKTAEHTFSSYTFHNTHVVTAIGAASAGRGPPSLS